MQGNVLCQKSIVYDQEKQWWIQGGGGAPRSAPPPPKEKTPYFGYLEKTLDPLDPRHSTLRFNFFGGKSIYKIRETISGHYMSAHRLQRWSFKHWLNASCMF